jgi:hypothetical protein
MDGHLSISHLASTETKRRGGQEEEEEEGVFRLEDGVAERSAGYTLFGCRMHTVH